MAFVFTKSDPQVEQLLPQLEIKGDAQVTTVYIPGAALQVTKQGTTAEIIYGRRVELFRGIGLLAEHSHEDTYCCTQNARFTMNGVMLDCSRNAVSTVDSVKQWIDLTADMGYNCLMLYTEDTWEVDDNPYFGYMRGR